MLHLADLKPMLLDERPFDLGEPGWIYELKFDGHRLLAEFGDGDCHFKTGDGADASTWFPKISESLSAVSGGPYITDGEVCPLDENGRSDFEKLHARAKRRRRYAGPMPVVYCIFDLLVDRGVDITSRPLLGRKTALSEMLKVPLPGLLLVGTFDTDEERLSKEAGASLKLDGWVAKKLDSVYLPGVRSTDWVMTKRKGAIPA